MNSFLPLPQSTHNIVIACPRRVVPSSKRITLQPTGLFIIQHPKQIMLLVLLLCGLLCWQPRVDAFSPSKMNSDRCKSSPTRLEAVSVLPATREGPKRSNTGKQRWHKGVIKRVFRRGEQQKLQAATLLSLEDMPNMPVAPIVFDYQESLLNDALTPMQKSSTVSSSHSSPFVVVTPINDNSSILEKAAPIRQEGPITRTTRSVAESTLESLLMRWCNGNAKNLRIQCEPKSNVVGLARGLFRCDATVDCDFIKFPCLQFSGGRLSTQRLTLNLYSFSALHLGRRFPNQFDFQATDILFTANDLFHSDCIRNGLARLLTRILQHRGMTASKVRTESLEISREGKLSFRGRVVTGLTDVAFEVRTGLATASRGHVLTFPGLQVSLSPALGIFFPVPDISLDLGYASQIHKLQLDPATGLRVSCQTTVQPKHTLTLLHQYAQSTNAYAAPFSVDVGRWLTRIGNFSA